MSRNNTTLFSSYVFGVPGHDLAARRVERQEREKPWRQAINRCDDLSNRSGSDGLSRERSSSQPFSYNEGGVYLPLTQENLEVSQELLQIYAGINRKREELRKLQESSQDFFSKRKINSLNEEIRDMEGDVKRYLSWEAQQIQSLGRKSP